MTLAEYCDYKRLYPNADAQTLYELQKQKFHSEMQARFEAEQQGKEYARIFASSFEKELEKLFK